MLCDKCAVEVETVQCKSCGKDIIGLGPHCYLCGNRLEEGAEPTEESDIDFEERILCSDGTCIGLVEKGVCKVCGKPYVPET
jgi:hypothetical protein